MSFVFSCVMTRKYNVEVHFLFLDLSLSLFL